MPVLVALLRGVNVGGHHLIKMSDLRSACESIGLRSPSTYLQSGNVVFHVSKPDAAAVSSRLAKAIEKTHGFCPGVVLRTAKQLQAVIDGNPFAGRPEVTPEKLTVTFFEESPGEQARARVRALSVAPEELFLAGRDMYVFFANGMGRSKFPTAAIGKILGMSGTARNWNTVRAVLDLALQAEAAESL